MTIILTRSGWSMNLNGLSYTASPFVLLVAGWSNLAGKMWYFKLPLCIGSKHWASWVHIALRLHASEEMYHFASTAWGPLVPQHASICTNDITLGQKGAMRILPKRLMSRQLRMAPEALQLSFPYFNQISLAEIIKDLSRCRRRREVAPQSYQQLLP